MDLDSERESSPLLHSNTTHSPSYDTVEFNKQYVKRLITVEPILIIMTLCATQYLSMQYFLIRLSKNMNLTSYDANPCIDNSTKEQDDLQLQVQETATIYNMFSFASFLLPMGTACLLIGPYTDKRGRKYGIVPPLLFAFLGLGLETAVVAGDLPLFIVFFAKFLQGFAGGLPCITLTSYAYITDITTAEQRSFRFLIIYLCMVFGGMVSVTAYGFLITSVGFLPIYFGLLILLIPTIFYAIFFLSETIMPKHGVPLFTLENFKSAFRLYAVKTDPPRTCRLVLLLLIQVQSFVGLFSSFETFVLYFSNHPFCWNVVKIGVFVGSFLLVMGLGSMILVVLTRRFINDTGYIRIGVISGIIFLVGLAASSGTASTVIVMFFGAGAGLAPPMAKSAATKTVMPNEQGQLQASISLTEQTGLFLAALFVNFLYGVSLHTVRGLHFYIIAVDLFIVFIMSFWIKSLKRESIQTVIEDSVKGSEEGAE